MKPTFDPILVRRLIHEYPELGYAEKRTASLICEYLDDWGVSYEKNVAKTGVIATINKGKGAVVVLRADMDALPIQEETNLEFKSKREGLMHACGHDLHTAILLGALHELKDLEFNGTVKFVFQPSEEGVYDDVERKSGGQRVVENGWLDDVDVALGLHVFPELPVGKLVFVPGQALANVNFFEITITGEASHAGLEPQKGKDTIMLAALLVQQSQTIITRLTSPTQPVVISYTQINGGVNQNILAAETVIKGTIRALDLATYDHVIHELQKLIKGIEIIYDVTIELKINAYYPSLLNDINIHGKLLSELEQLFGSENILSMGPVMGGEDFAFYSRKVPSV